MKLHEQFRHCPRCGKAIELRGTLPFSCGTCGFTFYFNPAVATAAIVARHDGRILLVRRARDPHRGKLSLPGGFVDFGETAECGLRREVLEEVGLQVESVEFFCSLPNEYHFKDVTYQVLDLFFVVKVRTVEASAAQDEIADVVWLAPAEVDLGQIAFPSVAEAVRRYRDGADNLKVQSRAAGG